MIPDVHKIRSAVALYRVSTRQQELKGESLFNQERAIRTWADENGTRITQEIRCAESGKSALRLVAGQFQFSRRLGYARLIRELQAAPHATRPDAVVIDWGDRWSRNVLEYVGIIKAFQLLGIRVLALGDGKDLTDPENSAMLQMMAVFAEEQLRITSGKVKEARRSRRERKLWQGGLAPDGYRTHEPQCPGRANVSRSSPNGQRSFKQRACGCRPDVLRLDPAREPVIRVLWHLLESSPLSWQGLADTINAKGHRRPDGQEWRWNDIYRIGENPAYCGTLATNRSFRDPFDGSIMRRRPLLDQRLEEAPEAIPEPFISAGLFWSIWERRYNKQTRHLPRAKHGASSELTGILTCPECEAIMTPTYSLSSKICGNGKPRKSARKKYVYAVCPSATKGRRVGTVACANRQRVRVDIISRLIIDRLAQTVSLSDEAIIEALAIERQSGSDVNALGTERRELIKIVEQSDNTRHVLTRQLLAGALTDGEYQKEIFQFRRDVAAAEERLRAIAYEARRSTTKLDLEQARTTVKWLATKWNELDVPERAEALQLLVSKVTYRPTGSTIVTDVRVVQAGRTFAGPTYAGDLPFALDRSQVF